MSSVTQDMRGAVRLRYINGLSAIDAFAATGLEDVTKRARNARCPSRLGYA
jgi:hypothetical protein